jgi:glycosyltransferase involved in cell wall biosynthesis
MSHSFLNTEVSSLPQGSQAASPLVSYIMPTFNRANVVGDTLDAIIRERETNYPHIEIVVIDGGSDDGTVDIIKSHLKDIQVFVSEKDSGAADAFNKGIKLSKGEIIRFVASDDILLPGYARRMVDYLIANPETDILGAGAKRIRMDIEGREIMEPQNTSSQGGVMTMDEVLTWDRSGIFAYIETWFCHRRIFDRVGYLDTRYRICSDVDFAFRAVGAGCKFYVLPDVIINKVHYADGSNLISNVSESILELRSMVRAHAGPWKALWFFWSFPAPLPSRIFWSAWLKLVKRLRVAFPGLYRNLQKLAGR